MCRFHLPASGSCDTPGGLASPHGLEGPGPVGRRLGAGDVWSYRRVGGPRPRKRRRAAHHRGSADRDHRRRGLASGIKSSDRRRLVPRLDTSQCAETLVAVPLPHERRRGRCLEAVPSELDDRRLVSDFIKGDESAFRLLYRRHTPRLQMLVTRLLGSELDVDDVVQETWIRASRAIPGFRWESELYTWLRVIAVRCSQVRIRERIRGNPVELPATIGDRPPDVEGRLDLERAVAALPDRQRLVVVLHDVEGYTHDEIARQLGIASGTSRSDLSRARTLLRATLTGG